MKWVKKQTGFTIVELLIVVVVIAILAAITIVAFNGIQNRAKESALQSSAKQAASKLMASAVKSGEIYPEPADFNTVAGVTSDVNTTYTYIPSTDRKNFCVSATNVSNSALSYGVTGHSGGTMPGQCTTNLVNNPGFEAGVSGWSYNIAATSGQSTDWAASGTYSLRIVPSTTGQDTFARLGGQGNMLGLAFGETYTFSATSRSAAVQTGTLDNRARRMVLYSWTNTTSGSLGDSVAMPNTVGTLSQSVTFTVPATITGIELRLYNGATNSAANMIYWDNVMLTKGSTKYQYSDGSKKGWFWDGSDGASASIGPAIP